VPSDKRTPPVPCGVYIPGNRGTAGGERARKLRRKKPTRGKNNNNNNNIWRRCKKKTEKDENIVVGYVRV